MPMPPPKATTESPRDRQVFHEMGQIVRALEIEHEVLKLLRHDIEGSGQFPDFSAGFQFDALREISASDGFTDGGHLFEVVHHLGEHAAQFADLVTAADINRVFKVTRLTDLTGNAHKVPQWLGNRLRGTHGNGNTDG